MAERDPETRGGFGSPSTIAAKLFGLSDPGENGAFTRMYDSFAETQTQRDSSGYVNSIERAEGMAPNAVKVMKSQGRRLDEAVFGQPTGIVPGHMSTDPSTLEARRALHAPVGGVREHVDPPVTSRAARKEPEATGFQALYDKIFAKDGEGGRPHEGHGGPSMR